MSAQENYYELLNVSTKATEEEIGQAFKKIAIKYHPDKCDDEEAEIIFTKCSQAYDVLCDPVNRALYDIMIGVKEDSEEERRKFARMQRAEARKAVALMEQTVAEARKREADINGLVILEARYGDLYGDAKKVGCSINVTVPLQCLVEDSQLLVPGGSSKSWLEGFYDPWEGHQKELFVRYRFLGNLHECVVADTEELILPLEEHFLPPEMQMQPPSFERRKSERDSEERKKRRRRWFVLGSLAVIAGFFFAKRRGMLESVNLATPVQLVVAALGSSGKPSGKQAVKMTQSNAYEISTAL